jgi:hypothetical protein
MPGYGVANVKSTPLASQHQTPPIDKGSPLGSELRPPTRVAHPSRVEEAMMGRGILLWLLGVPIPVIILLWLFFGR